MKLFQSKLFSSKTADFENEALVIHNEYRRDHGVPPLVLNKELNKVAQKWADELAKKDSMAYSLNKKYGESVYSGWSADPNTKITAKDCIDKWYSEINEFSFGQEPSVLTCGHFTQIVWKDTKELGIGTAKSKSGKLYAVANYSPPGNFSGQFTNNVLPPGANQFKPNQTFAKTARNNNQLPSSPRNSKNLGGIATDLVNKFKSTSVSDDSFEQQALKAHNDYRRKHGVPLLELNKKLSKYAEEWAKELVKKGKMEHRDQNDYGENIFYAWSSDPNFVVSGKDPVDKWYAEIKDHKFGKEPTSLGTGHFTQVVWEDTREVGIGIARSKDGHVYVVANYSPPGNMIGNFASKVPAPISK